MNIKSENILHSCTSCGVCASICPTNAITICLDKDGFYRPFVEADKCIDCSLCTKICYKYNEVAPYNVSEHPEVKLLAVQAKDDSLLQQVTSGGVAALLVEKLYNAGYICVGVVYDTHTDSAKHICAATHAELNLFKGSKYIQSYTYYAFKEALNGELKGRKIAIFGTPCQIYAIDTYVTMKNRRDDFLLIDIYCHGTPSLYLWKKYTSEIKFTLNQSHFDKVEFRSKIKGWGNFVVTMVSDGIIKFVSDKKKDEFYQLFFSNLMLNDACKDCALRSTLLHTDIRLGDFWGNCYDLDQKGVSAVTLVTKRAKDAYKMITNEVISQEHSFDDFLPFQSWGISYIYDEQVRKELFLMLKENKPLSMLQSFYFQRQSLNQKIKRNIRNFVLLFPPTFIKRLKKQYHTIKALGQ